MRLDPLTTTPPGTYAMSCVDIKWTPGTSTLYAKCATLRRTVSLESALDPRWCQGNIFNDNGTLACMSPRTKTVVRAAPAN